MYSPTGWIFGSANNTNKCDIQLAENNKTGISRKHLRIDISPDKLCPRLNVLSSINPVRISDGNRTVTFSQGENFDFSVPVTIEMGKCSMRAWKSSLSFKQQQGYRDNAERFSRVFMDALPKGLSISSVPSGASTLGVRFGINNAVYACESSNRHGQGSFATILKVTELRSGAIYAAKEPYHLCRNFMSTIRQRWEELTAKFT